MINPFLFVATYADGSQIVQTEDDKSANTEGKNCYFDVISRRPEQPVSFVIHHGGIVFGVDLRDGHFETNGIPTFQHRPDIDKAKDFKLLYFRITDQSITANMMTGERSDPTERAAGYTIGWEADLKGEKFVKTMTVFLN